MATSRRARRAGQAEPLPEAPAPMLCTLVAEPFDDPAWVFEPKLDGLRVVASFDGREPTLLSRNDKVQNGFFPEVADALAASLRGPAVVDGEIVCLDEQGRSSFRALQQRFHLIDAAEVRRRMERHPAMIYLFDVLYADGRDLRNEPLSERKSALDRAVRWSDRVRRTEFIPGRGTHLLNKACEDGQEGIVGKRLDGRYVAGRNDAWVKIKCVGRQEFVVGGWTDPQRSRVGLGALLVGYYDDRGKRLNYAGKVGTGYTRDDLDDLRRRLDPLGRKTSPFDDGSPPTGEGVHWVDPRLVAEIGFGEWTQNGLLRQPRFEGLRPDKPPRACRRERPKSAPEVSPSGSAAPESPGATPMPLDEYDAKRDFTRTREPSGRAKEKSAGKKAPIFVVQEHHASHLHYDFRLESGGVLKSWAVPKEPTLDPSVKRLAVQVEDHPLAYATFHGTIPEGEYGGGTVSIWDHGTYETISEADGRLEFVLHGDRLRGKFALIRMKARGRGKPQWLLMKSQDEFARPEDSDAPPGPKAKAKAAPKTRAGKAVAAGEGVEITHPDKVMFPDAGLTKKDVADYYERVAGRLIPSLKDRPATLERLPDGLTGDKAPHFWQKDTPDSYPEFVARIDLPSERGEPVRYALVNDVRTLLYLVNQGALTFHVWASRVPDLDRPDVVLFDIDPGPAGFAAAVATARAVRDALKAEGVKSFVKTSGKSGLHVLTAWAGDGGYDEARAWALGVATRVAEASGGTSTVEIRKAKRQGRVYIDVMQNARGHHAVPPYVIRAVPGASVSTPLHWRELTADLDPSAFTPSAVLRRLSRQSSDPLAPLLTPAGSAKKKKGRS